MSVILEKYDRPDGITVRPARYGRRGKSDRHSVIFDICLMKLYETWLTKL